MPIINGEKYACQSCIKGHRVSGCQHNDRELQHINPKGRPVKQCDHCRNSRKSKSHHARCDCGHKKDKKHEDGENGQLLDAADVLEISNLSAASGSDCACHTGAKCICGTKKEHGLKLETSSKSKPRLTTTQSESTLTVFANGHHKPCHRLNNTAHTSGLPYKIPRHHTLHGLSSSAHHSNESVNNFYDMPMQRRSMDCLGLPDGHVSRGYGAGPNSQDSQPLTPIGSVTDAEEYNLDHYRPVFGTSQAPGSALGSGSHSPVDVLNPQPQWPWSTTMGPPVPQYGLETLSTSPTVDYMPNENDWAIPSAGLQPSWSATDLPLHPEKFTDSANQPVSHCGDSTRASVPGLSTSSSQSEMGEPNFFGDLEFKAQQAPVADPLWEDALQFRRNRSYRGLSTASTPPDLRHAPTSVPTPENPSRNSLDLEFIRRTSPPMAAELENNYLPQRPFSNPLLETIPQEKMASPPTSNPFMPTSNYSTHGSPQRSNGLPSSLDGNGSGLSPWLSYLNPADIPTHPYVDMETNNELTTFTYSDNFS